MPTATIAADSVSLARFDSLSLGNEDGAQVNARRSETSVQRLADSLRTFGVLVPLIVTQVDGKLRVLDGDRRLKAIRHIIATPKEGFGVVDIDRIPVVVLEGGGKTIEAMRDVDAVEISLVLNSERLALHAVDEYEVCRRLADSGMAPEVIAARHGVSVANVRRALALASLSDKVRAAWRAGQIEETAARAFTLAANLKAQDKALAALLKEGGNSQINAYSVRTALGIHKSQDAARLVAFVGIPAYREAGGKVIEDLFGNSHVADDAKLAQRLAQERLDRVCEDLRAAGWKWAAEQSSLPPQATYQWQVLQSQGKLTPDEQRREKELVAIVHDDDFDDEDPDHDDAAAQLQRLRHEARMNGYGPAAKARSGCIVSISREGALEVRPGVVRPEDQVKPKAAADKEGGAGPAGDSAKPKPSAVMSGALTKRLGTQLEAATKAALAEACSKRSDRLMHVLGATICGQIAPGTFNSMPHVVQKAAPHIRDAIEPAIMAKALAGAFDAEDYFASAPKATVIKALMEMDQNFIAKTIAAMPRKELLATALAEIKTPAGKAWLPRELRWSHYAGPGAAAKKKPKGKG